MSKCFSIGLNEYKVYLSISGQEKPLERNVDVLNLVGVLREEGFHNFDSNYGETRLYGHDVNGFKNQIASATLGVPRNAYVSITPLVKTHSVVLVTLTY